MTDPTIVYFGGEPLGVPIVAKLHKNNLSPSLIVCSPDRRVGRKQLVTPPPLKLWAHEHSIPTWQPETYKTPAAKEASQRALAPFVTNPHVLFVVVAYNFILPQWLLDLSPYGVINVHPSLLPKLRGASPIRTAIKDNLKEAVGVSVMLLDDQMDHGPILAQKPLALRDKSWPLPGPELDHLLADLGGDMLVDTIPLLLSGESTPYQQEHTNATYCGRFDKRDSEIIFNPHNPPTGEEAVAAWHKINAWDGIGGTFFIHEQKRVKINQAELLTTTRTPELRLLHVTPAGKKTQSYQQWFTVNCANH